MSLDLALLRDIRETYCTVGVMQLSGHRLQTMEKPWVPNPAGGRSGARFESCVSDGVYRLVPHRSEKFGNVWAMINPSLDVYHYPGDVPKGREAMSRAACLIHAANYAWELLGCIAPGRERVKQPNGDWMVTSSRDSLNILKTVIGAKLDVTLTITWAEGLQPREAT